MNCKKHPWIFLLPLIIAGCGGDQSDLRRYVAQVQARPAPPIDPMPEFLPYESFAYSAAGLRSPFERPVPVKPSDTTVARSDVKPDETRVREFLEEFSIDTLRMVGTLAREGEEQWALVNDGARGIHRVKVGNYIGRNHGRILDIDTVSISVMEIVPDGRGGWVERPRSLPLIDTEAK